MAYVCRESAVCAVVPPSFNRNSLKRVNPHRNVVVVLSALIISILSWAASPSVKFQESEFRAVLAGDTITITVPITSVTLASAATVTMDLLDPTGRAVTTGQATQELNAGGNVLIVKLRPSNEPRFSDDEESKLAWYRVRYTLTAGDFSREGIVALGAIAHDVFEVRVAYPSSTVAGGTCRVRVHALNPVTLNPVAGVQVRGELTFSGEPLVATGTTNPSGDAILVYKVPSDSTDDGDIDIEARKGTEVRKESGGDITLNQRTRTIINTDKLLYQPGQNLHARALVFGPDETAIAGTSLDFTLRDPEGQTLFAASSDTNQFGIASVDWDLPETAELGDYTLEVEASDTTSYQVRGETSVKISRYDLPNFTVAAMPDKPYYLPGQDAEIEVTAKYLFGKELTRGTAKLVRHQANHWDGVLRRYVSEDVDIQTADLDGRGRAKFHLSLEQLHDALADSSYKRFEDVDYAAFVTDPTTGRSEQRRLTIRLSRSPIHVYVSNAVVTGGRANFYLSTYRPDGKPAECEVWVFQKVPNREQELNQELLLSLKTNRYGLARVKDLKLSTEDTGSQPQIHLVVRDKSGQTTTYEDSFWVNENSIDLKTNRTIYKPGDSIEVAVRAPAHLGHLVLEASNHGNVLWSGHINLRNHKGFAVIPYFPALVGEIAVVAYSLEAGNLSGYDFPFGSQVVLYPHPTKLSVQVNTDRSSYKPGEEVNAALKVTLPDGGNSTSALGIVVVDKAVEERVRTDQEFHGNRYGFWDWSWWRQPESAGGYTRDDLDSIDSTAVSRDMDLAAEFILNVNGRDLYGAFPRVEGGDYNNNTISLFEGGMKAQLNPARDAVYGVADLPTDTAQLRAVLSNAGIELSKILDPWNTPYQASFGINYRDRFVSFTSAGPDKRFATADDIEVVSISRNFFQSVGLKIDREVREICATPGLHVNDMPSLRSELSRRGFNLDGLIDPWGHPYEFSFSVVGSAFYLTVASSGGNTQQGAYPVWTTSVPYFTNAEIAFDNAIDQYVHNTGIFPQSDAQLDTTLALSSNNFRQLVDPWGHAYYVRFHTSTAYSDRDVSTYTASATAQTSTPITQKTAWIEIWSAGSDGTQNTKDDFSVATMSRVVSEQSGKDATEHLVVSDPLAGNTGAIEGVVTDPTGAVVPDVTATAHKQGEAKNFSAKTDTTGKYLIRNLEPGIYEVEVSCPGFRQSEIRNVPVHSTSATTVNVTLNVGAAMEAITVEAEAVQNMTLESAEVSGTVNKSSGTVQVREQTFTPRVRDYFPETLYWAPSFITEKNGKANIKFKLADNITTWKMSVLASTKKGEIGAIDTEIQAFQPFFIEHEPPKILTVGDEIVLPVVVRNYLPSSQHINIEMKPATWFSLTGASKQQLAISSGDSGTAMFPFRALLPVKGGNQELVATNRTTGDAISKPIAVHPDGEQRTASESAIVRDNEPLKLSLPTDMIQNSLHAELKLYPNLLAHVVESIEASLERPYGCGEQTTSSTYPSVLLLEYYQATGIKDGARAPLARHYLALGYRRLLNYRASNGGFSYWGHGDEPDVALTAYVIRFLKDAAAFVDVDPELVPAATKWLISQQQQNGTWKPHYGDENRVLTAYVALTLAREEKATKDDQLRTSLQRSMQNGLASLTDPHEPLLDPYSIANVALAQWEIGNKTDAIARVSSLKKLAEREGQGAYWALERNTPFYSWGLPGRLESTANAVLSLATISPSDSKELVSLGTMFLLKEKDRYGIWYSGQTTVNVLHALMAVLPSSTENNVARKLSVLVNGQVAVQVGLDSSRVDAPVLADITGYTKAGDNSIVISGWGADTATSSVQAVASYYVPWANGDLRREAIQTGETDALRLKVQFDGTTGKVGEKIQCHVEAERIGSRGHGMLLAEIGLPPGAQVDRESLDTVVRNSGWTVSRYDVLPDRLVLYLWPYAGGSKLTFTLRPRFGLKARSAPSVLYDYYNPEARTVVAPTDFVITTN